MLDRMRIQPCLDLGDIAILDSEIVRILQLHDVETIPCVQLAERIAHRELIHRVGFKVADGFTADHAVKRDLGHLRQRTALTLGRRKRFMQDAQEEKRRDKKGENDRND